MKYYIMLLSVSYLLMASFFIVPQSESHSPDIKQWAGTYVKPLAADQMQLLANVLLFSDELAKFDIQIRNINDALLKAVLALHKQLLSSTIDNNLLQTTVNCAHALKILVPHHQQLFKTWQHCCSCAQEQNDPLFQDAFDTMQLLAQNATEKYAALNTMLLKQHLTKLQETTHETAQNLNTLAQTLAALSQVKSPEFDPIILADSSWNASEQVLENAHKVIIESLPIVHHSEMLQTPACDIFKACYKEVLELLSTSDSTARYQTIMFDEQGLTSDEHREPLPALKNFLP